MKVLVTGGTGFVGKHLVEALKKDNNVRIFEGKVSDVEALRKAVKGMDIVYHLAAVLGRKKTSKEEMFDVNVNGVRNLVSVLDKQKLVFISSVTVFGYGLNLNEDSKFDPVFDYGKTKVLGEEIVRKYNNHVIIRPSLIYGEGDMFLLNLFNSMKTRKFFLVGSGNNIINLIYVKDLTNFLVSCKNKNGIYVLASHNIKFKDFYPMICNKLGAKMNFIKFPKFFAYSIGLVNDILKLGLPLTVSGYYFLSKNSGFDNSKILKEGFKETPLELGIDKTIKWYKENNLL